MDYADLPVQQTVLATSSGIGIVAGALFGWVLGPERGLGVLGRVVSRAALILLVITVVASLMASAALYFFVRVSLVTALCFFSAGLTQTIATASTKEGLRRGDGRSALALVLCLALAALLFGLVVSLLLLGA